MFNFIPMSFLFLLFLGLRLGSVIGLRLGIGNLKHIWQVALPAQWTSHPLSVCHFWRLLRSATYVMPCHSCVLLC